MIDGDETLQILDEPNFLEFCGATLSLDNGATEKGKHSSMSKILIEGNT